MLLLSCKLFESLTEAAVWGADKGSGLDLKRSERMKELLCQLPALWAHHLTPSHFNESFQDLLPVPPSER